jgi:hypothetical protein
MDQKDNNIVKMKVKLRLIFENKIVETKFEKVISNIKKMFYFSNIKIITYL